MSLVKLARLMSIFTSKKVRKFLIRIQMTKSDPKRTGDGKCQLGLRISMSTNYSTFYRIHLTQSTLSYRYRLLGRPEEGGWLTDKLHHIFQPVIYGVTTLL